ncbi:hypothetical protein HHI36_007151 [Cryptolaemus montrouzieri]|uniref:Uncharacterized protein n=1 Tax=Cryptolaemus montrouzieri TaxID=559131 RepID=A0ABD2MNV7_9CUCU
MDSTSVVCFCALISVACGGWLEEMISPQGLDLGAGFSVRLEDRNITNSSFFDNHAFRMDYGNYGVCFSKNIEKDAVEVELMKQDPVRGRGQKMGNIILPAIIGFKAAGITAMVLFAMKVLVVKAFMVAKFALLLSSAIFIKKYLFHDHHHEPTYVEIEHHGSDHHPIFMDHGEDDDAHAATNYVAYANYAPSAAAQSQIVNYAIESAQGSNLTGAEQQIVVPIAAKRSSDGKKIPKLPFYTIRKVTLRTAS